MWSPGDVVLWCDTALGRFASADSIISPVMFTDPSGHTVCEEACQQTRGTGSANISIFTPSNGSSTEEEHPHHNEKKENKPEPESTLEPDLNPNDVIPSENLPNAPLVPYEIDALFHPLVECPGWAQYMFYDISEIFYGNDLITMAQDVCLTNYCNNPLNITMGTTDPIQALDGDYRNIMASYYTNKPQASPAGYFLQELGVEGITQNPWNYEPNWIMALEQINGDVLQQVKIKYMNNSK